MASREKWSKGIWIVNVGVRVHLYVFWVISISSGSDLVVVAVSVGVRAIISFRSIGVSSGLELFGTGWV